MAKLNIKTDDKIDKMIEDCQFFNLTQWEEDFIQSVSDQNHPLTAAQENTVRNIYDKYN